MKWYDPILLLLQAAIFFGVFSLTQFIKQLLGFGDASALVIVLLFVSVLISLFNIVTLTKVALRKAERLEEEQSISFNLQKQDAGTKKGLE